MKKYIYTTLFVIILGIISPFVNTVQAFVPFPNAPWVLVFQGATTPQPLDLSAQVPSTATKIYLQIVLMRSWADINGNIDVTTIFRLPGNLTTNYVTKTISMSRVSPGATVEVGGDLVIVPNGPGPQVYWLMQGNTLSSGVDITLAVVGYE